MAKPQISSEAPAKAPKIQKRVYKNTQKVDLDLWKLLVEKTKINDNYNAEQEPIWVYLEHTHVFRTVDSSGEIQHNSSPMAGHVHPVTVVRNPDGIPTITVGPASVYRKVKLRGRTQRTLVPLPDDDHTHDFQYLGSESIQLREMNMEFAKLDAAMRAKENQSVPGIIPG